MKQLLIMRHAKSDHKSGIMNDIDRPLTNRGIHDATSIGMEICKRNFIPGLILVSPAKRAVQTMESFIKVTGNKGNARITDWLYPGDVDEILGIIRETDDNIDRLMIIGHNPSFEMLASELVMLSGLEITLPTAGLAAIRAEIFSWNELQKNDNKLEFLLIPGE